jgi:hypothetical protein
VRLAAVVQPLTILKPNSTRSSAPLEAKSAAKAIMRSGVHHNSLRRLSIFGLAQDEFAFCESAAPSADVVIVIELRHG